MKRILALLMLAAMLAVMAVSVAAAPTFASAKPAPGTLILEKGPNSSEMTKHSGTFSNLKDTGGASYCHKKDAVAQYDITVEKDGTYTFVVEYIARPDKTRFFDYQIDDGKSTLVDLEESADKRWVSITADLKAGKHTFYLKAPTGFDDSVIKSCDIYGWALYLTKEAPKAAAPTDAPATSDTVFAAVALLAVSATAAIVITKKQK